MTAKMKVLIVEDEPAIGRAIKGLITQYTEEFEVMPVSSNGKEGLDMILSEKPDIVLTDIKMPIMNGLEMIEQARKHLNQAFFCVLTGFGDFEYARTAMKLDVKEYLLKPVRIEELLLVLKKGKEELLNRKIQEQINYLKTVLYGKPEIRSDLFQNETITFIQLFYGTVFSNYYNEIQLEEGVQPQNDFLKKAETELHVRLYMLGSRRKNEYVYAMISENNDKEVKQRAAALFLKENKRKDTYLNVIVSESTRQVGRLAAIVQNCIVCAGMRSVFGRDGIIYAENHFPEKLNHVTEEIKNISMVLPSSPTADLLEEICAKMCMTWEKMNITQYQLLVDLRFVLEQMVQKSVAQLTVHLSAEEMIAEADSFMALQEILKNTLFTVFSLQPQEDRIYANTIMQMVREYLEQNFDKEITYKNLNDLFGFSKKYIALLFKETYGFSPGKYVNQLRIEKAKEMLKYHPEYSVQKISELVGFRDSFYFSKVFKQKEGLPPSEYRKQF